MIEVEKFIKRDKPNALVIHRERQSRFYSKIDGKNSVSNSPKDGALNDFVVRKVCRPGWSYWLYRYTIYSPVSSSRRKYDCP